MGCEAIAHSDPAGAPLRLTDALRRRIDVDTAPTICADQALALAERDLRRAMPVLAFSAALPELVVFPRSERIPTATPGNAAQVRELPPRYHLAHHVQARFDSASGEAQYSYMIDAHSGKILARWNDLHTAASIGVGNSAYSATVRLDTSSGANGYELRDTTRGAKGTFGNNVVVNLNHATHSIGTLYTDADNTWGDGKDYVKDGDTASGNGQTAAVDAAPDGKLLKTLATYSNMEVRNDYL